MTTIRRQLTWKVLAAFIATLVLGGVGGFAIIRGELQRQFDAALGAQADAVESVLEWDKGRLSIDTMPRFMHAFDAIEPRAPESPPAQRVLQVPVEASVYQIWRADTRTTLARSGSLGTADLPFVDVPPRVAQGPPPGPRFVDIALPSGRRGRAVSLAIRPRMPHEGDGHTPLDAVLVVVADRGSLDRTLDTVALVLSGCGLLLIAVTSIVVPRVLRREIAPLDRLADQAARIDAGTLATRFQTATLPGELVPIGERLNDLLSRLEDAFERERQFSADVAHELRTPIAELRTLAELALKWPDARHADHDRDTLQIATHMEGIVTRLLALLRSERGQLAVREERVPLAPLLENIWRPLASRAMEKQLAVAWRLPRDLVINTDAVLLRSILTNVLENAVEYAPAGGAVEIAADDAYVRIANTVDGLTQADVPKLFDRFWRREASRSGVEHSGLGLAVARAFARALCFDLTATLVDAEAKADRRLVLALALATRSAAPESDRSGWRDTPESGRPQSTPATAAR